jgi:hypothetical protein
MRTLYTLLLAACLSQATLHAQIDNGSFENWNFGVADTTPVGWRSSSFGIGLTTDATAGSTAVQVWNWYYYGKGWITNNLNDQLPTRGFQEEGGAPISIRPVALSGQYKYEAGQNQGLADSAVVLVSLSRFNTQTSQRVPVGYAEVHLPFSADFQTFNLPIDYFSALQPDSFVVAVLSSLSGFCGDNSGGNCLYLTVDQLAFETTSGTQAVQLNNWKLYPNPARDQSQLEVPVDLQGRDLQLSLESPAGVVLWQETRRAVGAQVSLDTRTLAPGTYFLRLGTADGRSRGVQRLVVLR